MDLVVSLLGLLLLAPFFLLFTVLIAIDSKGPVFYHQSRVGKDNIPFNLLKFRTMRVRTEQGPAITIGTADARITSVGKFLRRFKLDELPQLVNVLKGDMSLVGPRPEVKQFVDLYTKAQLKVLSVRPGITDYASIEFRNENELLEGREDPIAYYVKEIMPAKLALNLRYLNEQSLWLDIRIIFRTLVLVFVRTES